VHRVCLSPRAEERRLHIPIWGSAPAYAITGAIIGAIVPISFITESRMIFPALGGAEVRELLHQIDQAMAEREPCRIYVPDLCQAAGLLERASFERRRFEMITRS
jgi:hypothetical protein